MSVIENSHRDYLYTDVHVCACMSVCMEPINDNSN